MAIRFAHEVLRPIVEDLTKVGWVALSFDEERLGYALDNDSGNQDLFVAEVGSERATRLVAGDDFSPTEIAWSPSGEHLAYLEGETALFGGGQSLGICGSQRPGELACLPGLAFAWMPDGRSLLVADVAGRALNQVTVSGEMVRKLATLHCDPDPQFPPTLAVTNDGHRIAYVCRRGAEGVSELWLIDGRRSRRPELLIDISGAGARVQPFWSPDGESLAFSIVDLEAGMSTIMMSLGLEGQPEAIYENSLIDFPAAPVWLVPGDRIALFRTVEPDHAFTATGPSVLSLLEIDGGKLQALGESDACEGRLRSSRVGGLIVDGGGEVHRFVLSGS